MSEDPKDETGAADQLHIHVNFNNLQGKLGCGIDRCVRIVCAGYAFSEHEIESELRMPGSGWQVHYSSAQAWSPEECRNEFRCWVIANGFRDLLESFGLFLDQCFEVASYLPLFSLEKVDPEQIQQVQESQRKVNQSGIDKKLTKLKPWLGKTFVEIEDSVRQINCARNILTHHGGVIPESYVDPHTRTFRLWWKRLVLQTGDGQEVFLGQTVPADTGVFARTVTVARDFATGERLLLQALDFSGICWTLFQAGESLRQTLETEWMS